MKEVVKKLSWTSRMIDFGGQMTMHHQWLPLIVYKEENATHKKRKEAIVSYNVLLDIV
jgi:hypothetical protein